MEPYRPSDHTVLVVDDEADIVGVLGFNLRREGYRVLEAASAQEVLALARAHHPSLVVLDLMLPDIPGVEVCRALRADPATAATPIIMLTARGTELDRVAGFESGADDYVTKPFSVREVVLRVRAHLRARASMAPAATGGAPMNAGLLAVDPAAHRVLVDGAEVPLSALEWKLLVNLLEHRGRVRSRETLLDEVWGYTSDVETRTVDTHIKRLRDKLGAAGEYIETLRGVGYRFTDQPARA